MLTDSQALVNKLLTKCRFSVVTRNLGASYRGVVFMPKQLQDIDTDAAAKPVSTGGVQVKSVSATGNIKISLKSTQQAQPTEVQPELRAVKSTPQPAATAQVLKKESATRTARPAKNADAAMKPATKTGAKVQKSGAATSSKLASASAQGGGNLSENTAPRSSLKPLGVMAAVLGTVALTLGVMHFAGGTDTQVAAAADASQPMSVEVATAQETSVILAPVEAEKAAIVAPVQAAADGASGDVTAEAIAAAVAKLAPSQTAPQPVEVAQKPEALASVVETLDADALEKAAFASASLFKADPEEVRVLEREESDRIEPVVAPKTVSAPHVSTAEKLALVSYLSALPDGPEAQEQASALSQKMTSGTLAALSQPKSTTVQVEEEPVYIFDLVVEALAEGRSDAELDQILNESYAAGRVTVPSSLILADGRVDSKTILALFAGK